VSVEEAPALGRRRLGAELKRCREAAGLTQQQVSREFEWHAAKVTRIEAARVAVTPRDVKDLLSLYEVHDRDYRESLVQLARPARGRVWWADYRDILPPAGSFITLEADASVMCNWEQAVVPGLLQTEAYMRALYSTVPPEHLRSTVDRMVSFRLNRRHRLTADDPLTLRAVIDESVIHRRVGGADVLADQLRHLIAMSELPTVDLRILPFKSGEHPLLGTAVAILEFHDAPDLNVVYVEQFRGTHRLMKRTAEVTRCRDQFEQLTAQCLDPQRTIETIEAALGATARPS
jgi:transcriptional regulator with XRE-family HTH domain